MTKLKDQVERKSVDDLLPYPNNPKKHPDEQVDKIAASIDEYGFVQPIVVQDGQNVVIGHGRLKAAKKLGLDQVPVIDADHLTEAQAKALRLADNRVSESGWDEDALQVEFEELGEMDFDTDLTGFDEDEVSEYKTPDAGEIEGVETPEPPEEARTNESDLWILGDHRLLCGDATNEDDVKRLIDGDKIDLFVTDPPYGVSYSDKNEFLNEYDEGNRIQKNIESDHGTVDDSADLWKRAFSLTYEHTKDGGCYYITGPQGGELSMMMMMMIQEAGFMLKHCLVWVKNNHVLGRCDYHYKHEPILYGWKEGEAHYYSGNGPNKSVWEIDKPLQSEKHPTMKPVELFSNCITNGSRTNEIVYDCFAGSGTTAMACEQLNRMAFMMESDPHYCDVIVERWEDYTGKEAYRE